MKYGIVVFPPKEVQDFANNYRKRYDPQYNLIPPHITVRSRQHFTQEQTEEIVALLEKAAQQTVPFTVHLNRFSTFYPASNVIYIAMADTSPLVKLHDLVCQGILKDESSYTYTPHITVGQNMGDDELHDVLASLRKKTVDFRFQIDRIHLLYQTENESWTAYQSFLFKGKEEQTKD
jgi:2'-5' RNA ligase